MCKGVKGCNEVRAKPFRMYFHRNKIEMRTEVF
jgi:hypothetical protein